MNIEAKINQILEIVTMNQQDLTELKERVTKIEERMTKLEERVKALEQRMAKLEVRVTSLERSVFLIETQHGDKINALFDAMKSNEDAHRRIEQSIQDLKSEIQGTLFNHEKRISKLEGNLVPSF